MGLDMYLSKRHFIGAEYEHRKITGKITVKKDGKKIPVKFNKISEIIESVGYWRKANQIHNWFVQNVQDGVDNCQESYVSIEQLKELKQVCERVIKFLEDKPLVTKTITPSWGNPYEHKVFDLDDEDIEKVLPTSSGFFFGGTKYDEHYLEDLESTISILSDLDDSCDYYYRASW